jgi:sialate O-acetylesterase
MKRIIQAKGMRCCFCFLVGLFVFVRLANADIKLPAIIGSHMVLQQQTPIQIWGWAEPGEEISVTFADQRARISADGEGKWKIKLKAMTAGGGPYTMTISGTQSRPVILDNILLGEVWVCSGQSNMEWELWRTHSPSPEIQRADFPQIRLFHVPRKVSTQPLEDMEAEWKVCNPETARYFSAVAYYFGREIHKKLEVPVGLISTRWGGTPIEPWTPVTGFKSMPELHHILEEMKPAEEEYRQTLREFLPELEDWIEKTKPALSQGINLPLQPEIPLHPQHDPQAPTVLYNAMIHPLIPFAIRGAIWYQGESNRNDGLIYTKKMEALISGWREVWNVGDFPFYYVQLAPYDYSYTPEEEGSGVPDHLRLPLIWEAQLNALKIPNTGMAVITDIGNLYDIHPRNKKDVGCRLSLWALAKTYGWKDLVYSGPLYKSMAVEGDKIRIRFDHVGSGLISLDNRPLTWFEIAGPDRIFYKARAEINGDSVLVWSDKVTEPVTVRFGWHQVAEPNLGNKEGLPASPFRTDRW